MRLHRFINSLYDLYYLLIQLVAKESKAKENNARTRCLFVLFLEKGYISQVIHFKHKRPNMLKSYLNDYSKLQISFHLVFVHCFSSLKDSGRTLKF